MHACLIPPAHHAQVERGGGEYRSLCQISRVWEIITSITSYFEFSWFAQLVHIAAPLTRLTQLRVYRSGLTVYMYPLLSQPAGDSKSDAGTRWLPMPSAICAADGPARLRRFPRYIFGDSF